MANHIKQLLLYLSHIASPLSLPSLLSAWLTLEEEGVQAPLGAYHDQTLRLPMLFSPRVETVSLSLGGRESSPPVDGLVFTRAPGGEGGQSPQLSIHTKDASIHKEVSSVAAYSTCSFFVYCTRHNACIHPVDQQKGDSVGFEEFGLTHVIVL